MSPCFEFECQDCGEFEVFRQWYELEEVKCPSCGGEVRRKYSPFNFTFGWRLSDDSHDPIRRETRQGGKDKLVRNV